MTRDRERDDERVVGAWMDSLPDLRHADPNMAARALRRHMLDRRVQAARWRLLGTALATVVAGLAFCCANLALRYTGRIETGTPAPVRPRMVSASPPAPAVEAAAIEGPVEEIAPESPPRPRPRVRPRPVTATAHRAEPMPAGPQPEPEAEPPGIDPELYEFFALGPPNPPEPVPVYKVETREVVLPNGPILMVTAVTDAATAEQIVQMAIQTDGYEWHPLPPRDAPEPTAPTETDPPETGRLPAKGAVG